MPRHLWQQNPIYILWKLRKRRGWRRNLFMFLVVLYVVMWLFALFNYRSRCRVSMPGVSIPPGSGYCQLNLFDLKLQTVDMSRSLQMKDVEAEIQVSPGGLFKPIGCKAQQKVAVIIPYRDRMVHLKMLLKRLHPMLQRQKLHYQIFIIEQAGNETFNRGLVRNAGFREALNVYGNWDCFIFHDVDLIPEHDRNLYYCDDQARHLSPAIDELRYHEMYYNLLGGVAIFAKKTFETFNGYSNLYWDWGNEDDEMSARTEEANFSLTRPPSYIGRYKMVRHVKQWRGENGNDLFFTWRARWKIDGLNSLNGRYDVLKTTYETLYTNITIKARPPNWEEINTAKGLPRVSLWWFLSFYFP